MKHAGAQACTESSSRCPELQLRLDPSSTIDRLVAWARPLFLLCCGVEMAHTSLWWGIIQWGPCRDTHPRGRLFGGGGGGVK